jgi:hypothetical protein
MNWPHHLWAPRIVRPSGGYTVALDQLTRCARNQRPFRSEPDPEKVATYLNRACELSDRVTNCEVRVFLPAQPKTKLDSNQGPAGYEPVSYSVTSSGWSMVRSWLSIQKHQSVHVGWRSRSAADFRSAVHQHTCMYLRHLQACFSRSQDGLRSICYLQLAEDVGHVVAHGLGAQRQPLGNRGVGQPLRQQGQ